MEIPTYIPHPHHRDNNPKKSQWTISVNAEIDCFHLSITNNWIAADSGWGLNLVNGLLKNLGIAVDRKRPLFIAKFVDKNRAASWHGYPADHMRDSDRPTTEVLVNWTQLNLINRAKMRKISRGVPCSL